MKRYRRTRLTKGQEKKVDHFLERLAPLKRGKVVSLSLRVRKIHGKQHRETNLLALLAPGRIYGMVDNAVVVSIVGKGSCVIFPDTGKGKGDLARAGVPVKAAEALLEKLRELFGENNG